MIVSYTKFPSTSPVVKGFWRPMLDVKLINLGKSIRVVGMVDSGSDHTLVNKEFAPLLGLTWNAGIKSQVAGIDDVSLPMYLHEIEFEVINLAGSRRKIMAGFVDFPKVTLLLGQIGFFENYVVRFKRNRCMFDVELA
jgi:hypothetical protein